MDCLFLPLPHEASWTNLSNRILSRPYSGHSLVLSKLKLFTEEFIRMVHKRMYSDVWAWAGEFRKTNKNLGIDKWQIPTELRCLLDDARYWHVNNVYSPEKQQNEKYTLRNSSNIHIIAANNPPTHNPKRGSVLIGFIQKTHAA